MDYYIEEISGNSFTVRLLPVTTDDNWLLQSHNDANAISTFYHDAIRQKFGDRIHISSLTPNDDYPYSATIECISEWGSV